ncbi:MAG: hypothetical protein K2P57_01285 [Burkholderiales bacterium]|nr:hypothetical protein [Burkholderiales bacterium]
MKFISFFALLFALCAPGLTIQSAHAAESNLQIAESFNKGGEAQNPNDPTDRKKREIMFVMGIPLLIMLIATAALGVAMGVFGKKVFVVHMVMASLSLCLAVVHAIVGLVWFFPF